MFARIGSRPAGKHRSNSWKIFSALVISSVLLLTTMNGTARAATGPRCYVMASASGLNNGNSWTDAYTDLQSALTNVVCSEIWVAAGVYKPTSGSSPAVTFTVHSGVAAYGGFAGTETLLSQRDPVTNLTILSGDIDNDDSTDSNHIDQTAGAIKGTNSTHVLTIDGTSTLVTSSTILDGFTITGGMATGAGPAGNGGGLYCIGSGSGHECNPALANLQFRGSEALNGGALYNDGSSGGTSDPTLTSVTFSGNGAMTGNGGAMYDGGDGGESSPILTGVVFESNRADGSGGAMHNDAVLGGTSSPHLNHVTFLTNSAAGGGAMWNYAPGSSSAFSSPQLTDVIFQGNTAQEGGAMGNIGTSGGHSSPILNRVTFYVNSATNGRGGAMLDEGNSGGESNPQLTDVTFASNSAQQAGGGMVNIAAGGQSNPSLQDVTFSGNSALNGGGLANMFTSAATLDDVILWGDSASSSGNEIYNDTSTATIQFSDIQGSGGSGGSWDSSLGTDGGSNLASDPKLAAINTDPGSLVPTLDLQPGSAAIDTGDDVSCPSLDARGVARPLGVHCDMGAYEWEGDHIRVDVNGFPAGTYRIPHTWAQEDGYPGLNNGPAQVTNTDGEPVVSSIRVIFAGNSYSEMMGNPEPTNDFWFPFYNNVAFSSQLRVSNLGASATTITVDLGGSTIDSFTLAAGAAVRKSYPGQNGGPMHVSSSGGTPILSTIRVLFGGTSYSEMMGSPINYATDFYFPWYNNVAMDSQFRVSNLGGTPTTITVSLAGSPIDSFTLPAGAAIRKNYAGQNNGPMHVSSSVTPILSTIRVLYASSSYSEMMGYPNASTPDFWFPWYDNVGAGTQFRVSNLGGSPTTITVSLGGTATDTFLLPANSAVRKSYAGKNAGGFHVTSSVTPILATERILYGATSFYELTGFPTYLMTSTQYFPWYNDAAFDSQMRIAVP